MRRLLAALIATALGVVFTHLASAADLPTKAPVYKAPLPVWSWTGFYVGGHAGWGWGHDPFTEEFPGDGDLIPSVTISDVHSDGFVAGFQAGYNQQWGNWT
jgi:outer membrane immunogenic protein